MAASKGLMKLLSYLGVYALMLQAAAEQRLWWDRLVAGLLSGGLLSSVLALRQLYASTEELARWADPNSDRPARSGSMAPWAIPISWRVPGADRAHRRDRTSALAWGDQALRRNALVLGSTAVVFTYSRGGWLGLLAALAVLMLFCCCGRPPPLASALETPAASRPAGGRWLAAGRGRHAD